MSPTFYGTMKIQRARILLELGRELSRLPFTLIHILPKDLFCFTFCTLKYQEPVRGDLLPLHKSFKYFLFYFSLFKALPSSAPLISLCLPFTFNPLFNMGRFIYLVGTPECIESFKAQYRIPPGVSIRYCKQGDWYTQRQEGEVVIPMIAFIEGWMRIPMNRITRDYLIAHKLTPTQCAPNMFRILSSVDALNEKMGVNLTHHDVNWIYNRHKLTGQGYYLKTRVPAVRLILCLPESNKRMNKDFVII